jgi:primosomal protein N''
MWSFLLGFGTVAAALANGPSLRRTIAQVVLTGSDLATDLRHKAYRASLQLTEDFEDAFAEVAAEREAQSADASLQSTLQELQRELEALREEISRSKN